MKGSITRRSYYAYCVYFDGALQFFPESVLFFADLGDYYLPWNFIAPSKVSRPDNDKALANLSDWGKPEQKYTIGETVLYFGDPVTILDVKWDDEENQWRYSCRSQIENIAINEKYWIPEDRFPKTQATLRKLAGTWPNHLISRPISERLTESIM